MLGKWGRHNPLCDTPAALNELISALAKEDENFAKIIGAKAQHLNYLIECRASPDVILAHDKSLKKLIFSMSHKQNIIKGKLESALNHLNGCHCPSSCGGWECKCMEEDENGK
jgi:hypothetical protein